LGHNLDIKVIGEGVENERSYRELRSLQCDLVQGDYISEALHAGELLDWLRGETALTPRLRTA
jgi:EAL domain-containing protein (putative c-di-GMP-specific phosphodiesterase class I)